MIDIQKRLERGDRIDLDEFGIEWLEKDKDRTCSRCGSSYRRTHGGWGSVCYECGEGWFDGFFVPEEEG